MMRRMLCIMPGRAGARPQEDELFAFSTRELQKQNSRNEQLRQDIDRALTNGEIKAYLQFIVDNRTSEICGAEVLSRWEHPELGVMRPGTLYRCYEADRRHHPAR